MCDSAPGPTATRSLDEVCSESPSLKEEDNGPLRHRVPRPPASPVGQDWGSGLLGVFFS